MRQTAAMTSPGPLPTEIRGGIRVGIRVDGSATMGVGHVVRCLALSDELRRRGIPVSLYGDVSGAGWLDAQIQQRGLQVVPAAQEPSRYAEQLLADHVSFAVLDGYHLPAELGETLRAAGIPVLAIVDGAYGAAQQADLYLDQNFGATPHPGLPGGASQSLVGVDYALFRDEVVDHRGEQPADGRVRVLAFFGGTDAYHAARTVVPLILATGAPVEVVAIASDVDTIESLQQVPLGPDQALTITPPSPALAALAVTCHAAVSAAGTSVWELLCLGVPAGLVCVVDNQELGYRATAEAGVALPVGRLWELTEGGPDGQADQARHAGAPQVDAIRVFTTLLTDPAARTRLREQGMVLVDGQGRARVVDAIERVAAIASGAAD